MFASIPPDVYARSTCWPGAKKLAERPWAQPMGSLSFPDGRPNSAEMIFPRIDSIMSANPDQSLLPAFPAGLGIRLEEVSAWLVIGSLLTTPELGNRNGVMHGGAIMAFADALGGVAAAVNLAEGQSTTTLESKTNFLRPIRIGDRITGRCEPLHMGRTTTVWQTTVLRPDGKPAAIVTQTQLTLVWDKWASPTEVVRHKT